MSNLNALTVVDVVVVVVEAQTAQSEREGRTRRAPVALVVSLRAEPPDKCRRLAGDASR